MIPIILVSHHKRSLTNYLQSLKVPSNSIEFDLEADKTAFSIGQIRQIISEAKIYQPIQRTYVFHEFDRSTLEAQNAFLKLLEEPPENIRFILVVSNPYTLLPTIISRAKIIRPDTKKVYTMNPDIEKALTSHNFNFFTVSSKEDCLIMFVQLCLFFRERYFNNTKSSAIIKEILTVYRLVQNNNVHPQLALDHLLIFISKKYSMRS